MNNDKVCPECGSDNMCRIEYGYPADLEKWSRMVEEKKIHPGGCVVDETSPSSHCNDCGFDWGRWEES